MSRGNFRMRGYSPELVNTYDCVDCKETGTPHEIVDSPAGTTGEHSHWGSGFPTTKRTCMGCGRTDGPWVSADLVGGGW
jgi:hypothetical protein